MDWEEAPLPGDRVRVVGLKDSRGLNGAVGTLFCRFDDVDRWQVCFDDDGHGEIFLKSQNLELLRNGRKCQVFNSSKQETAKKGLGLPAPVAQQLRSSLPSKQLVQSGGLKSQQPLLVQQPETVVPQATIAHQSGNADVGKAPESNGNMFTFIKAARPDWSHSEVENSLERLSKVKVDNVLMLITALRGKGTWKKIGLNAKLEAAGEIGFADLTLQAMRVQADVLEQMVKTGQQLVAKDGNLPKVEDRLNRGEIEAPVSASISHPVETRSSPSDAFQAESQRRAASQRTSRNQIFKVVQLVVDVHTKPNVESRVIAQKHAGDVVSGDEETFDRWVRLDTEIGWICRGADEKVLVAEGDVPFLAAADISQVAGPLKFKVTREPHVPVCSVPVRAPDAVKGYKNIGDVFFAEAQSYDGWVRTIEGGWVPSFDLDHGMMLSCIGLEEEKQQLAQLSEAKAVVIEAKSQLHGHDLDHARAYARYQGWSVHLAELRRQHEEWLNLRQSILKAKENVSMLSTLVNDAEKLGFKDEVILVKSLLTKAAANKSEIANGHAELLQAITDAALSGDLVRAALARDTAREAGVSKKDISRAFALGRC